jgi:hypothetical protein
MSASQHQVAISSSDYQTQFVFQEHSEIAFNDGMMAVMTNFLAESQGHSVLTVPLFKLVLTQGWYE